MSQAIFLDPFLSGSGIVLSGTGNGTLSVDKLTHFTITQIYTVTCIAKTPDTIFSVSGSVDGPVGIATVGTQFFDEDLKVFLTILQGSTAFEVGDEFVFESQHGTDLNQDNIDDYDELPQKNFGAGDKGSNEGIHNLRLAGVSMFAQLYAEGLKFTAKTAGIGGNDIAVEYVAPYAGAAATGTVEGLTFTAQDIGLDGNDITVELLGLQSPIAATVLIQQVRYTADVPGVAGNAITVTYTTGATAGSEMVSVLGNAITVQIESGVSTPTQIAAVVNANPFSSALVNAVVEPALDTTPQTAPVSATNLANGEDTVGLAGFEVVEVTGDAITVICESGVSTRTQIKAALDAHAPALALISTSLVSGATVVTAPAGPAVFSGGADPYGQPGSEFCTVLGDSITVSLTPDESEFGDIKSAIEAEPAADALIDVELIGPSTAFQSDLMASTLLSGGEGREYHFNHDEDDGGFFDGNGSLLVRRVHIQERLFIEGDSEIQGALALTNTDSGRLISNTQSKINEVEDILIAHVEAEEDVHGVGAGNAVVGTGTVQIITNKDYDGGTASNANRLTIPKNTTTNLNLLTRKVGTIVYDTTTGEFKRDDGAALKAIVEVDKAQVITEKDIDGGVASNTRRITVPKDTTTNLNGLTRKAGTLVFDTTTLELKYDNGTILRPTGSVDDAIVDGVTDRAPSQNAVYDEFVIAYAQIATKIGNVVEDTSPQLGGALDFNGQELVGIMKRQGGGSGQVVQEEYFDQLTLTGSQTNTVITSLTFAHASFDYVEITYRIKQTSGALVSGGTLRVITDGTVVQINDTRVDSTVDVGVVFSAVVSGSDINIRYTTTANNKVMRADVKRFRA